ncbi:uncharacterized protein LOC143374195 [Andrena cerasifolii]|uniref:uncharacterized protein LOC143374195 n=1 Tax=Andrena cerasifolii TaxID=2819439 RepID=UPI004037DD60
MYVPINYIGARTSDVPLLMTKFAEQIQRGSSDALHGRCSMAGPDKCSLICILEGEEGMWFADVLKKVSFVRAKPWEAVEVKGWRGNLFGNEIRERSRWEL